jgi:hypothetical protein
LGAIVDNFRKIVRSFSANLLPTRPNSPIGFSIPPARQGVEGRRDKAMRFLLRTALWTSVALALLPSFVSTHSSTRPVDLRADQAVVAASDTVADLSTFCERRPAACAAGPQLASAFGERTQAGAKILYDFIGGQLGKPDRSAATPHAPIAIVPAEANASSLAEAAKPSQNTLTSADAMPAWRGPPARRDGPTKRSST